ncbi:hypothetical protein V8C42DRAFT_337619 [Trichoderma barbatum]
MSITATENNKPNEPSSPRYNNGYNSSAASAADINENQHKVARIGTHFLNEQIEEKLEADQIVRADARYDVDAMDLYSGQEESETMAESIEDGPNLLTSGYEWQIANGDKSHAREITEEGKCFKHASIDETPGYITMEELYCGTGQIDIKDGGVGDTRKMIERDLVAEMKRRRANNGENAVENYSPLSTENNDIITKSSQKKGKRRRNANSVATRAISSRLERVASRAAREKIGNLPRHLNDSCRWQSTPPLIHAVQTMNLRSTSKAVRIRKYKRPLKENETMN